MNPLCITGFGILTDSSRLDVRGHTTTSPHRHRDHLPLSPLVIGSDLLRTPEPEVLLARDTGPDDDRDLLGAYRKADPDTQSLSLTSDTSHTDRRSDRLPVLGLERPFLVFVPRTTRRHWVLEGRLLVTPSSPLTVPLGAGLRGPTGRESVVSPCRTPRDSVARSSTVSFLTSSGETSPEDSETLGY